MKSLTNSPLHSLHILPPGLLLMILLATIVVLAALLAWWWWRRRRMKTATSPHPAQVDTEKQAEGSAFAQLVLSIRDEHLAHKTYREGCHALSAATKGQLEQGTGAEAEEMTVDEIAAWVNEPDLASFFTQLRHHQFGKRPPDRDDFKKMCRAAPKTIGRYAPPDGRA